MPADEKTRLREQIVRMKNKDCDADFIAECVGLGKKSVQAILRAAKANNGKAVKAKKAGRTKDKGRLLNETQEKEIKQLLKDKTPEQFKMNFMLWTREAVVQLIKDKYGIELALQRASDYLKRWGMTCQRPSKQAYFQDNIKVKNFTETVYPTIKKRAKAEKAEIYWGDEVGVSNQEYYLRGFSPKGTTPVLKVESKQERINMISAINNNGVCRFKIYDQSMNQELFIEFMERLITDTKRKVFLIVDNLKVHHGKNVAKWLEENKSRIELFFIPPYSPELNPDEYLNHALKLQVHSGIRPRTKTDLEQKVKSTMENFTTEKIQNLFKHKKLNYLTAE